MEIFEPNNQMTESNARTGADKRGAVVFLGVEDYVKETERQLNNEENYRKIN